MHTRFGAMWFVSFTLLQVQVHSDADFLYRTQGPLKRDPVLTRLPSGQSWPYIGGSTGGGLIGL